jgi:hypothetical protein
LRHFVGFPSRDRLHAETIATAAKNASTGEHSYAPWSAEDGSGTAVERAVEDWIADSDAAVFDLTYVNDNLAPSPAAVRPRRSGATTTSTSTSSRCTPPRRA